ncbi:IS66 family insertion sequence element accessory protein TnpA [Desulfosporosinus sp. SYSU MS00001]|uniref:IS66 family insertion sequence element accessory protein TnpA n=1 Tax=Desulfosporosinus sp. SYSU MS00001 TaxID=3416284 RepID=UPI003CECB573
MDKITHEMRLMQWTDIVRECRSSGMAVKAWCLENNINEKKFYYWQRRIRGEVFGTLKKTESQSQSNFVQLPVPADSSRNNPSFRPDMTIHIGNNVLELSNTVSEELLSKVLKVMSDVK